MLELLHLEIFQYDFIIRALIAGSVIGIIAPLVGIFLVVKRYSLIADTLAHITFLGTVIGFIYKLPPLITGIVTSIVAVFGIEKLRVRNKLPTDSLMSLFLSGSLAISTVLISLNNGFNLNLFSFLFGSITTVTTSDVWTIVILGLIIITIIITLYKELFFVSFNEELAQASGVKVNRYSILITILAVFTVTVSLKIVGALLIGALMVIPVLSAINCGRGFRITTILSVIFSLFSVITGIFASYYFGLTSGGTIVMIALTIFIITSLIKR